MYYRDLPYPICPLCNTRRVENKGAKGVIDLRKTCRRCREGDTTYLIRLRRLRKEYGHDYSIEYREKVSLDKCSRCGFVPQDSCQLDVDHIDRDHWNDEHDNLRVLCANCHRLRTWRPHLF